MAKKEWNRKKTIGFLVWFRSIEFWQRWKINVESLKKSHHNITDKNPLVEIENVSFFMFILPYRKSFELQQEKKNTMTVDHINLTLFEKLIAKKAAQISAEHAMLQTQESTFT